MITNAVKEIDFTQISEESLAPDLNLNLTLKSCVFELCRREPKVFLKFKPDRHSFLAELAMATPRSLFHHLRASITCFRC